MKGWRTLLVASIVALIGVLEAFNWADVIPDNIEPYVLPFTGVIFGFLRMITNTAVGQKESTPTT